MIALFAMHRASAATTPLAAVIDPTGDALQRSMIWATPTAVLKSPYVAFRRRFDLAAAPPVATLRLFADARYLLWVNGAYVLRGPARFDWKGPEYDSVDLSHALHAGANELVVLVLGNQSNGKMMRHVPGLTAELSVPGAPSLRTDTQWRWSDQTRYRTPSVNWGNVLDRIDARVDPVGDWTQIAFDDSTWKPAASIDGNQWGPLSARRIPLLRETPVTPATLSERFPKTLMAGEKFSFSIGRLVQAYTVLDLDADAGSELSLDYAGIKYIARAGRQQYISSDTHGFAGGVIAVKSGRVTIHSLKLIEVLYPFDAVGRFSCSDPLLNKLWATCTRSLQVLSEDAYVDCADRERTEWMDCDPPSFDVTRIAMVGPPGPPGASGTPAYADARLLQELLRRTALSLQPGGWVKAHTCSDRFDVHAKMEDRACDFVEGARRYFDSTADAAAVAEIWPVIDRQLQYFLDRRSERGLVLGREWEVWGNPIGYVTCEGAGLNAFVYKALVDGAYLGRATGHADRAAVFDRAAQQLARAFDTTLWDEKTGGYFAAYCADYAKAVAEPRAKKLKFTVDAQNRIAPGLLPALFAIDQGIVLPERRARVQQYVLDHRGQADRIMMFYYLTKQMYEADTASLDQAVLDTFRTKWKAMADSPWQTTWEEFTGGSKAHCYGMFPAYFLSTNVLGVRPVLPLTERRLMIEPRLADLTFANGVVVTEYGPVALSWKVTARRTLDFNITVPTDLTAAVRLPDVDGKTLMIDGAPSLTTTQGRGVHFTLTAGQHVGRIQLSNKG